MADVAALTGDKPLLAAVDTIWKNMVTKKMYVQGGTGAVGEGERFGANYELPNTTAYNETCASVADVYWQQRMFQLHGDANTANLTVNKKPVQLVQQNNYPWDGGLKFVVNPAASADFNLLVRVPGWARGEAMPSNLYTFATPVKNEVVIKINGKPTAYTLRNGYAVLPRKWRKGDVVEMTLPMDVRRVVANPNVKDDLGKVALQRGPIMYCAEWPDNQGKATNFVVPPTATFTAAYRPELLNGVTTLTATVPAVQVDAAANSIQTVPQTLTAIPYYAWANRGKGEMTVWFPAQVLDVDLVTRPAELPGSSK
nr:hypothetical protein [Tanacetum cinerariifolium]